MIKIVDIGGVEFQHDTINDEILDCPGFKRQTGQYAIVALYDFTQVELRSLHQRMVDKFMRLAHQNVPLKPQLLSPEERVLRARLIIEEALETVSALGVKIDLPNTIRLDFKDLHFQSEGEMDMVGTVDGCFDLRVVTTGTLSAAGVPDSGQRIVDLNNLNKFGPGHSIDSFGKLVKPPDHQPPNAAIGEWLARLSG
jgi:predicted HAD superfamily Cof-like phosphohydrolase